MNWLFFYLFVIVVELSTNVLFVKVSTVFLPTSVSVIVGKVTITVAVPDPKPGAVAVIVAIPLTLPGVTVTLTPAEPAGTVTLGGTVATLVSLLDRLTIWPPGPAGADSITISEPGALVKFSGLPRNTIPPPLATVIVTVTGLLLVKPLFTISCTT